MNKTVLCVTTSKSGKEKTYSVGSNYHSNGSFSTNNTVFFNGKARSQLLRRLAVPITLWDSALSPREQPVSNFTDLFIGMVGVDVTPDKTPKNP